MNKEKTQQIREQILPIIKAYKINYAAIFGSFARGENKKDSDLDLLVNFSEPVSYFDLVEVEQKIARKIKIKKVDLVTLAALHPLIRKSVNKDLKVIYDQR